MHDKLVIESFGTDQKVKYSIASSLVALLLVSASAGKAGSHLDLIAVLQSDSGGAILIRDCMSPGDLNEDGYSEVFASELGRSKRLLIFSGGNPPNTTQFVDWGQVRNTMAWIPDINGDSVPDFAAVLRKSNEMDSVCVWFGGDDFLSKTVPDLVVAHPSAMETAFGQAIGSGDINGDGQNDLIIGDPNAGAEDWYGGRFYIYYGGSMLDSILDDSVNVSIIHITTISSPAPS